MAYPPVFSITGNSNTLLRRSHYLFLSSNELEFLRREAGAKTLVGLNRVTCVDLELLGVDLGYGNNFSGIERMDQG